MTRGKLCATPSMRSATESFLRMAAGVDGWWLMVWEAAPQKGCGTTVHPIAEWSHGRYCWKKCAFQSLCGWTVLFFLFWWILSSSAVGFCTKAGDCGFSYAIRRPMLRSAPSRLEEPHPSGLGNRTPNVHQETPRGAGWRWNCVGEHINLWPLTNPMMSRFLLGSFRVAFWLEWEWWTRKCYFFSFSCCCCCCSCSIWFGPTFIASGLDSHPGRPGGARVRGRASVRGAAGDLGVWQVIQDQRVFFSITGMRVSI